MKPRGNAMRYWRQATCVPGRMRMAPSAPVAAARTLVLVGLLLLAAIVATPRQALAQQSDYTVTGIPMSAQADDAVTARKNAIDQAERRGLQMLVEKLSGKGEGTAPPVDGVAIDPMVQSYEIASEAVGAKSYKGTLNVTFAPARVRDFMRRNNVAVVPQRHPTLIVPAVASDSGLGLWFDADSWRGALGTAAAQDPSLKLSVPLGDAQDLADLSPAQAQAGDQAAFGKLQQRYQTQNVVLATLQPGPGGAPASIEVKSVIGNAVSAASIPVPAGDDALAAAASATIAALRSGSAPKPAPEPASGPAQSLGIVVPLVDLASWVQVKRELEQSPGVRSVAVDRFSRAQAFVTLNFTGDVGALQAELNGRGLALLSENGQWRLQRAGDATPGAL